jgi:hypothetical protein
VVLAVPLQPGYWLQPPNAPVLVPAGGFLVGMVELKGNLTLHLAPAVRLLGSGDALQYSAGKNVPPGNGNVVMLYAVNAENIAIGGQGTIDGQGGKFFTVRADNTGPGGSAAEGYRQRPHLVFIGAAVCWFAMSSSPAAPAIACG